MTTKEMIEILRYKADNIKAKIEPEFFREVAKRLEKQVGKKPLVDYVRNSYKKYKCPMCKEEVQINYDMSYCLECGQKLDWSELND